jgi:CelD/BcsL family acetyltransferase involved in cellulose biosynthesis
MSFTIELVDDLEQFETMQGEWNELVASMTCPEVFYLWEWNFHYFRHYRMGDDLMIVVVRDHSGTTVGIAPLCRKAVRRLGCTVRVVQTIVVDLADYRNFLIRGGVHRGRVVSEILDFLHQRRPAWDVMELMQLCSRDATTVHLVSVAQAQPDWNVRVNVATPVAVRRYRVGKMAEDTGRLRRVRNRLKTLEKQGFRTRIGCAEFDELWPAFCDIHRRAWPSSPFHDEAGRRLFDDLRAAAGLKGKLEFSVMEFEGRPVAMHFGFVDEEKLYFYMPAMDPDFRQARVGAALLYAMVQHYGKSAAVFDFMRGLEAYKLWYTDEIEINMRIVICWSASLPAALYSVLEVARRFVIDLGLPKAAIQFVQGSLRRLRASRQ